MRRTCMFYLSPKSIQEYKLKMGVMGVVIVGILVGIYSVSFPQDGTKLLLPILITLFVFEFMIIRTMIKHVSIMKRHSVSIEGEDLVVYDSGISIAKTPLNHVRLSVQKTKKGKIKCITLLLSTGGEIRLDGYGDLPALYENLEKVVDKTAARICRE